MAPLVVLLEGDPLVRFGQVLLLKDWGYRVVAEASLKAVKAEVKGTKTAEVAAPATAARTRAHPQCGSAARSAFFRSGACDRFDRFEQGSAHRIRNHVVVAHELQRRATDELRVLSGRPRFSHAFEEVGHRHL